MSNLKEESTAKAESEASECNSLLACPFCGNDASYGGNNVEDFIECDHCMARPFEIDVNTTDARRLLTVLWNTRAG